MERRPQSIVKDLRACLLDFGTVWVDSERIRPEWRDYAQDGLIHLGTLPYRSPELLLGYSLWGREADIWAAGVVYGQFAQTKILLTTRKSQEDRVLDVLDQQFAMFGTPSGSPEEASA